MPVETTIKLTYTEARKCGKQLCAAMGIRDDESEIFLDCLLDADLRGIDTHGLRCLPLYADRLASDEINRHANIRVVKETPVSAVIDGDCGIGHVISTKAMQIAIKKAKEIGFGAVSVYNSNHNGAASYYSRMAQAAGMIGFSTTGCSPRMPAPGGRTPVIGNNPWSYAFPNEAGKCPVCLDMANSAVSAGKVMQFGAMGKKIPLTWALDANGDPVDDGNLFAMLQPVGGYKGYGIAVCMEILGAALSGEALMSTDIKSDSYSNTGHFFMAIDPSLFTEQKKFYERINHLIDCIKSSDLTEGVEQVYLPGEIEYLKSIAYMEDGIPYKKVYLESLQTLGNKFGIESMFNL